MKQFTKRGLIGVLICLLAVGMAGCGAKEKIDAAVAEVKEVTSAVEELSEAVNGDSGTEGEVSGESNGTSGLPADFPSEVPLYKGATVISEDRFNESRFSVTYSVDAAFSDVLNYYASVFDLDESYASEGEAYYEGIELGDILINGLTIEETSEGVNVFITLRDYRLEGEGSEEESIDQESDGGSASGLITYDSAEEVTLENAYPKELVPVYPDAKTIGSSMVPGTSSGFVDFILPTDAFEDAVAFYQAELGLEPKMGSSPIQKSAQFKGEVGNLKVVILISHLLDGKNDPYVQVTINENKD